MFMKPAKSRFEISDKYNELVKVLGDTIKYCFSAETEKEKQEAIERACELDGMRIAFQWLMNEDNNEVLDVVLKQCAEKYSPKK